MILVIINKYVYKLNETSGNEGRKHQTTHFTKQVKTMLFEGFALYLVYLNKFVYVNIKFLASYQTFK